MSPRRLLVPIVCVAVGVAIGVAARPAGSAARTNSQTPVDAFLAAVRHPSSGQFSDPRAAVRFLVEQVRTQNVAEATRVFPIVERFDRATFSQAVRGLQTVSIDGFFPGQPLSKLQYSAMRPLLYGYTMFMLDLLLPQVVDGPIIVQTAGKLKQIEAKLDPKRLSKLSIKSMGRAEIHSGSKNIYDDGTGAKAHAVVIAVLAGVGPDRSFEFDLEKVDTNWFVVGVNRS